MTRDYLQHLKTAVIALLVTIVMLVPHNAHAGGNIDITGFSISSINDNEYKASLKINYRLGDDLEEALTHGVRLSNSVTFTLGEHRVWWWNSQDIISRITYDLKYHALSKQYVLSRNDTGEHWNFGSLPPALQKMGVIENYLLPKLPHKIEDGNHYLFVQASVKARTSLSLPLKIQSVFNDKYKLESEGVLWSLP